LRVRHGRAFPFEKIAGVQARAVPQKYQMHFLSGTLRRHPASERSRYSTLPSTEVKKAFYRETADDLHSKAGVRKQDVFINLVDVLLVNWSFGNGEMAGAPPREQRTSAVSVGRRTRTVFELRTAIGFVGL
jgi:Tautomerase enzyme